MASRLAPLARTRTLSASPVVRPLVHVRSGSHSLTASATPNPAPTPTPASTSGTTTPMPSTRTRTTSAPTPSTSMRAQVRSFAVSPLVRWAQTTLFELPTSLVLSQLLANSAQSRSNSVSVSTSGYDSGVHAVPPSTPTTPSPLLPKHKSHALAATLRTHYNLHDRAKTIREALANHHPINHVLLDAFASLYADTARLTRLIPVSLSDPVWGLDPAEGYMTEAASRKHIESELDDLLVLLEREIQVIVPVGLNSSLIGRALLQPVFE